MSVCLCICLCVGCVPVCSILYVFDVCADMHDLVFVECVFCVRIVL